MSPTSGRKDVQAYPPTSLDFINRPNPVEPLAAPPKHPLHGSSQLQGSYTHDLRRLLLGTVPRDSAGEAATKRLRHDDEGPPRSGGNTQARDLPSLPKLPVRHGSDAKERRRRLPPTLSGLHQPPPNAGLLPSINVQQPVQQDRSADGRVDEAIDHGRLPGARESANGTRPEVQTLPSRRPTGKAKTGKHTKNKWSDEETADLLKGVARFGIGSWTKILKCDDYSFGRRTGLDLKDRFRVCCPEQYKKPKASAQGESGSPSAKKETQVKPSDRKGASELAQIGIDAPFVKSNRRSRHGYTKDEDEALLRGFQKYGKSWATIQKGEPALSERTPTDIRDRFRLRYPREYASTGLAPRPDVFPQPPDRGAEEQPSDRHEETVDAPAKEPVFTHRADIPLRSQRPGFKPAESAFVERGFASHISLSNDVFLGMPAHDEDLDAEPLVLDRGILDWAFETTKPHGDPSNGKVDNSQPLRHVGNMPPPTSNSTSGGNPSAPLPSLASITAVSDDYDQLELPSLMQYFPSIEGDTRIGGHSFIPIEELLSQT